ncbi:MAG: hypothetical protein SOY73_06535 [Blautia sp.]|nr:hypothetical protein [Blautia sp.]
MTQRNQLKIMNYAAILSIFLFSGAGSFMNAAVQTMMDAWPAPAGGFRFCLIFLQFFPLS